MSALSRTILFPAALLAFAAAPCRAASIVNSKHDMSSLSATTGPKSLSTSERCVFCHTPHRAGVNVPLWNQSVTTQTFTFYSSNYVNTYLGMAVPTMAKLAGSRTKLCLSCHDGMTAPGSVFNLGGTGGRLNMSGPLGSASTLGVNLADDHPVLYGVNPGAGPPVQPGTDPEIQLPPAGDKVKVYGAENLVECTSCHNPHDNQYGHFLVKSNANGALCTTCHYKTGFSASAHKLSAVSYTPPGESPTTVGEWACRDCHRSHGASSVQAYLLSGAEEATCYACHGNPPLTGARNLKLTVGKAYKHPVETVSGRHKDPETDGANFTYSPLNNRHAECQDCHNPHQAKSGTHVAPTNVISSVLLGQWGVEPAYGTASWTQPTSYSRKVFADTLNYREYQLCLKCHSSYAFGTTPPPGITDQSIELSINNRGAHPVIRGLNSQTGSTSPKPLAANQLSSPWSAARGTQTMYCSDCHGPDSTTDPKGPHGSAGEHILSGPNVYWPRKPGGALYTLDDFPGGNNSGANTSAGLFCLNCHPMYSGTSFFNNVHMEHNQKNQGVTHACVGCHQVIPHGSKRSRLIGYASDQAPYNYNGTGAFDKLVLSGFKKATSPTGYVKTNCYAPVSGCSSEHGINSGGYDP
ncbi:MAG: hypothetical protein M0025_12165 [Elusimicrobia bacterium]|nr:hypothetical protein [Elusimicrobiota bacterium]